MNDGTAAAAAPKAPRASRTAAEAGLTPAARISGLAGDPNFMTSLARGLAVIAAFSGQKRRLSIAQLSQETGIPRAAVRRCLYTLAQLGYVGSDDGRAYALRPKLLTLGHAYLSSTPLIVIAQPFLDRVGDAVGESCSLAVLDGDETLYLGRSTSSRIISVSLNVGSRLPAYCTSVGLVLLAALSDEALEAYLSRVELKAYTERTPATPAAVREILREVRESGYAIADQMMELGVRSIAVPVHDAAGAVVAGINVITQSVRGTVREMKKTFLPHLQDAARELGAQLMP
jgi:IclR family pca regulon transcriptional regulator